MINDDRLGINENWESSEEYSIPGIRNMGDGFLHLRHLEMLESENRPFKCMYVGRPSIIIGTTLLIQSDERAWVNFPSQSRS